MAIRVGPTLVGGLVEGGTMLMNEQNRRQQMASKYALLEMEKKLIAHRDLLAHGYKLKELEAQHKQRMAEILAMNERYNQPKQMTEEERAWWESRAEKEQAQADRYRRMNNEDQDRERKQLEEDVKYLDKRMGEITFTTKGEMGDEPKRGVYAEHGLEYARMAEERDAKLVQLGRMPQSEFDAKWGMAGKVNMQTGKTDLVKMGLIPERMQGTGGQYDYGSGVPGQGAGTKQQGQDVNDPLGLRN